MFVNFLVKMFVFCLHRPFWRSRFCVSYRYKAPPTTKKNIFSPWNTAPTEGRNTRQQAAEAGFIVPPNRQSTHARGSVFVVPFCKYARQIGGRQAERQTSRAAAAACVGSVSMFALFAVGISPTLEKLHKGTAFF